MKNLKWVILIAIAFLLGWYIAEMRKPDVEKPPVPEPDVQEEPSVPTKPPEWSKVAVEVGYQNGQVVIPERGPHDSAVLDEESKFEIVLRCEACPQGPDDKSRWKIKKFVRVAI